MTYVSNGSVQSSHLGTQSHRGTVIFNLWFPRQHWASLSQPTDKRINMRNNILVKIMAQAWEWSIHFYVHSVGEISVIWPFLKVKEHVYSIKLCPQNKMEIYSVGYCLSTWAAIKKTPEAGQLINIRNLFLTVLADEVSGESPLPVSQPSSHCALPCQKGWGSSLESLM